MRLPIIKKLVAHTEDSNADQLQAAADILEVITDARGIKDEEMDVIGELISNLYGAIEVKKSIEGGTPQREALNGFMQRVMGSIDR